MARNNATAFPFSQYDVAAALPQRPEAEPFVRVSHPRQNTIGG